MSDIYLYKKIELCLIAEKTLFVLIGLPVK